MNARISIILPNYNHAAFLQQRLESIFNQTYQDFEVIILDDCSTDASLSVLSTYKSHPKTAHFEVNAHNVGSPFKQWQKGIELAKGKFIWIAESDDFCELNFLETQLKILETADVAVAKTIAFLDGEEKHEVRHPALEDSKQTDAILYCPILNVSCVLFKAQVLGPSKQKQYTNYNLIGDRVFYFEHFRNAKIGYNSETVNYFRQSASNISKLNNRNLSYYTNYFDEHCQFIFYAANEDSNVSKAMVKKYISKFYNRVGNRVPQEQKRSITYAQLYLTFKFRVFFNLVK